MVLPEIFFPCATYKFLRFLKEEAPKTERVIMIPFSSLSRNPIRTYHVLDNWSTSANIIISNLKQFLKPSTMLDAYNMGRMRKSNINIKKQTRMKGSK